MVQLTTPWQEIATPDQAAQSVRIRNSQWPFAAAGVGAVVTVGMLFRPWLVSSGPNGIVHCSGFGQIGGYTGTGWNSIDPTTIDVNGFWAVLAGVAALATVLGAIGQLRYRNGVAALVAMGSAAVLAAAVLMQLLYLNGKVPEFRALTYARPNLIARLGDIVSAVTGQGFHSDSGVQSVSSAGLTTGAMIGGVVALITAFCAAFPLLWELTGSTSRADAAGE